MQNRQKHANTATCMHHVLIDCILHICDIIPPSSFFFVTYVQNFTQVLRDAWDTSWVH